MDCCNKKNNKESSKECCEDLEKVKGGQKSIMDKKTLMWIVIGVLFLLVIFLTFKTSSLNGNAVADGSGKLDTTGWTENEKMNYEMHDTIPARLQGKTSASSAPSSGMVGGC